MTETFLAKPKIINYVGWIKKKIIWHFMSHHPILSILENIWGQGFVFLFPSTILSLSVSLSVLETLIVEMTKILDIGLCNSGNIKKKEHCNICELQTYQMTNSFIRFVHKPERSSAGGTMWWDKEDFPRWKESILPCEFLFSIGCYATSWYTVSCFLKCFPYTVYA